MEITDLRKEIDAIDQQLVNLFCRRMDVAGKIAAYKKEHGFPIYHPAREQEVLQKAAMTAGTELADYVQDLYSVIFELSKRYQNKCNDQTE